MANKHALIEEINKLKKSDLKISNCVKREMKISKNCMCTDKNVGHNLKNVRVYRTFKDQKLSQMFSNRNKIYAGAD